MNKILWGAVIATVLFFMCGIISTVKPKAPDLEAVSAVATATTERPVATKVVPTATSTPAPTLTPVPKFTKEELEYTSAVSAQCRTMRASMDRFADLSTNARLFDSTWRRNIVIELATWQFTYSQAQKLTPSPKFDKMHSKYLQALSFYSVAADDIAGAIDDLDVKRLESAYKKVQSGNGALAEAADMLAVIAK